MYRTLDPDKIVTTLGKLEQRIAARFPGAGLARVATELTTVAAESKDRAERLARPNWRLRILVSAVVVSGLAVAAWVASALLQNRTDSDLYGQLQGIDAFFNITLLAGAAILFLTDVDGVRGKDGAVLRELSEQDCARLVADGTATGGMIPKIESALLALRQNPTALVKIAPAGQPDAVLAALSDTVGTRFGCAKMEACHG